MKNTAPKIAFFRVQLQETHTSSRGGGGDGGVPVSGNVLGVFQGNIFLIQSPKCDISPMLILHNMFIESVVFKSQEKNN